MLLENHSENYTNLFPIYSFRHFNEISLLHQIRPYYCWEKSSLSHDASFSSDSPSGPDYWTSASQAHLDKAQSAETEVPFKCRENETLIQFAARKWYHGNLRGPMPPQCHHPPRNSSPYQQIMNYHQPTKALEDTLRFPCVHQLIVLSRRRLLCTQVDFLRQRIVKHLHPGDSKWPFYPLEVTNSLWRGSLI